MTYYQFIRTQYETKPNAKRYYKSLEKYQAHYIAQKGFERWLETMRDTALTRAETHHVVTMMTRHGNTNLAGIPYMLQGLERDYGVTLPAVEGIRTKIYWGKWLPSSHGEKPTMK